MTRPSMFVPARFVSIVFARAIAPRRAEVRA